MSINERAVLNGILRRKVAESKAEMAQAAVDGALGSLSLGGKPRVDRAVARAILMRSPVLVRGVSLSVTGKSVGAGVWELHAKKDGAE